MIEVTNLTKHYGKHAAVDDLSFTVKPGVVTGFLGPNGAGKSTTMRMILGLDRPTAGQALVNGRPFDAHRAPLREIGALLDAKSIDPARPARAHLAALAATTGISKRRVAEVLDLVGLSEVADRRSGGFSLGMGQRLGIASALLGDPHTVILDEPVNGLDPEGILWIRNLLKSLAAEGRTVLVSSHLMSEMALTAEHFIIVGRGRLIADMSASELTAMTEPTSVRVRSPQADRLRDLLAGDATDIVIRGHDVFDVATCAGAAALILLRRRAPLAVLTVAVFAAMWSLIPDDDHGELRVAAVIALFTVASKSDRRTAWAAGAATAAAMYVTAAITSPGPWYDGENIELIAWAGLATAAGDAVRSRRAYNLARQERAVALQERAERAERALEEESRRRVIEERMRIARELHDVVAHHIAVINVQAGVAAHLLRDNPTGADEALTHVRRGAANVLDELSNILSVIRQPDDAASTTDPLPTLHDLPHLIDGFAKVGLDIDWYTAGAPRPLTPAIGLAAYRIVQEALTNAHRYGSDRRADLHLAYEGDALRLEIVNDIDVAAGPTDGTRRGYGTIGMRERVAAAGGTIQIGPTTDGRFRVDATLPTGQAEP